MRAALFYAKPGLTVQAAEIDYQAPGNGSIKASIARKFEVRVGLEDYTSNKGDGINSVAYALQKACNDVHAAGGGRVEIPTPNVAWVLDYPVFIRDNTEVVGTGPGCKIIYKNPLYSKGRGGFVFGSSVEANRDTALAAYVAGTYPAASTRNNAYVNPAVKQYLRDNPQFIEARNSSLRDVYLIAQFDNPADWGGYGVNFVNAWNCHAKRIWGKGWTQLIGMGSDVAPETPSNYLCTATELYVVEPDLVHTYYSVGFIANSTDCEISNARQYKPCVDGTTDGNGVATNIVEDCVIKNIKITKLGRGTNSQGVLLNNAKGCVADDIYIGNAKTAVATFYTDATFNDAAAPNKIGPSITADTCDYAVNLGAKRATVFGYNAVNCTYDLAFQNLNATNNIVNGDNVKVYTPADQARRLYFANNTVKGWKPKTIYLRPADILLNPKDATVAYDVNKGVEVKTANTTLNFLFRVPEMARAVDLVETFVTYKDNAQAAGTNFKIQIRRMVGFNGNAGEAPFVEATVTDNAANTLTLDKSVQLNSAFAETANAANGLANSLDVLLTLTAPSLGCVVKETKITMYGD